MKRLIGALIGTVVAFGAAPASAAVTLNTDKNNVLLGASGVMIGSKTFRVDFVDGSCTSVFGKCAIDKFDFKTSDAVTAAISALFSQVLVGRYYANDAGKIAGCNSSICDIYIPYAFYDTNEVAAGIAANRGRRQVSGFVALDPNYSYASDSTYTFARFTLQTTPSVPEPSSWAMMLAGFAVVGYAMRSRRKISPSIV